MLPAVMSLVSGGMAALNALGTVAFLGQTAQQFGLFGDPAQDSKMPEDELERLTRLLEVTKKKRQDVMSMRRGVFPPTDY